MIHGLLVGQKCEDEIVLFEQLTIRLERVRYMCQHSFRRATYVGLFAPLTYRPVVQLSRVRSVQDSLWKEKNVEPEGARQLYDWVLCARGQPDPMDFNENGPSADPVRIILKVH